MTRALASPAAGRMEVLGVRFRPGGASALLRMPAAELTDRAVTLGELGGLGAACAPVLDSATAHEAVPALASVLKAAGARLAAPDPVAAAAWARMRATAGALPVRSLAAELGVGERRLQRIFHDHVGLTPKEAARVARLEAVLALLRASPELPLGRAALRAGYYDQPHFNREFARLVGLAPDAWRAERVASVQADQGAAR
jgi:AraC-like DNA-binding protein